MLEMWQGRRGGTLDRSSRAQFVAVLKSSALEELDATEEIALNADEPRGVARVGCRATFVNGAWTKAQRKFLALQSLAPVKVGLCAGIVAIYPQVC